MSPKQKNSLYLIDGSALIYRSYFAFIRNPLINSKGEDTSAPFGFVNSLLKLLRDEEPDYVAVVFDTKHPTFRHEMYGEYKSTRAKMPEELVAQLPRIKEAVDALNIPQFELEGYEADDIIGTFARRAEKEGLAVWCVTGDKDFFQLVNDNVRIYNSRTSSGEVERYGPVEVAAKFGVPPERVIDKLALMGDSSDNVPGIPGIGPKTADKLLEQFGSLEAVLSDYEQISAKGVRNKVAENIESARLSKKLVTIATDCPVEFKLDELKRREINYEATRDLFLELEFTRLLKELMPDEIPEEQKRENHVAATDYRAVTTSRDLEDLLAYLEKKKEVAIDTETTSLNSLEAELVGVSLSPAAGEAYYLPLGHDDGDNLDFDTTLAQLKSFFESKNVQKFGQNIKYDLEVLHRYDIDIHPIGFDSMLASYVINPSGRQHSLDALAIEHFDYKMQPISDLIGKGKKQKSFATVPVDEATFYACEDADLTFRLRGRLAPLLEEFEVANLYYNIELPLIPVLASMEEAGVRVDAAYLETLSAQMADKLDAIIEDIYQMAGEEFNINSTQQLSTVLFDKLGLPTKGKTAKKTGYSTDVRVLEELALIHELPQLILHYRQLTKLKSTYIDAIPRLINERTGRVHTSFNQTIAATGRLSSTDPNLQNIPVRTEEGRLIRKAFVPRDGDHTLLVADYSQIELRVLAHYSEDPGLISAFRNKEDIHARTAAEVFGIDMKDVTPEQRRAAKTANFAVIYGVSAFGLAQQTGMSQSEAKVFIDTYFDRYPGIREYMDRTREFARDKGYVTTMFNRRRYLPEITSKNFNVRQFAERTAINTPIQGTAADMIKKAMLTIHDNMSGLKSEMILQVHDELIFDVHRDETDTVQKLVKDGMEKAVKLKVPVVIDAGIGENWLEAK